MGVSAERVGPDLHDGAATAVAVVVVFVVLAYLYGPAASPAMRNAAVDECNDHAEGNWRSFRLSWNVGVYPHWMCW